MIKEWSEQIGLFFIPPIMIIVAMIQSPRIFIDLVKRKKSFDVLIDNTLKEIAISATPNLDDWYAYCEANFLTEELG